MRKFLFALLILMVGVFAVSDTVLAMAPLSAVPASVLVQAVINYSPSLPAEILRVYHMESVPEIMLAEALRGTSVTLDSVADTRQTKAFYLLL